MKENEKSKKEKKKKNIQKESGRDAEEESGFFCFFLNQKKFLF